MFEQSERRRNIQMVQEAICSKAREILSTEILSHFEHLSIWSDFECMVAQSGTKAGAGHEVLH